MKYTLLYGEQMQRVKKKQNRICMNGKKKNWKKKKNPDDENKAIWMRQCEQSGSLILFLNHTEGFGTIWYRPVC